MNATLRIVSVSVSVFIATRCQSPKVIVAWSGTGRGTVVGPVWLGWVVDMVALAGVCLGR